jgi:ATP-dependent protease HslVU (ClpYQ) peptidase subunit
MTCIAAVTDGSTVWMGGDSAGSSSWDIVTRKDPKVFRNGEMLIGFTTSFRMGQLLAHRFTPPTLREGQDVYAFMVTDFVDAVRQCLKDGGFAKKDGDREEGGTFLVGFRGRLFEVSDDYQVGEAADTYAAVGCGHAYAKGSLFATEARNPADRIRSALAAAERHSNGVRGPFTILSSVTV